MTDKDKSVSEFDDTAPDEPRKPRKHGYRGYPNNPEIGGDVHSGTGFAGVGSTDRSVGGSSDIFTEKTQESVEEIKEDEEDEEERRKK
jgi:hypothetical protein